MVDRTVIHADDVDESRRPPGVLLGLPDELMEWADQNRDLVRRVHGALASTYTTLTDEQVWEAVAEANSPEWRAARDNLRSAETQWEDLKRPENTALGLIGQALDSDEIEGLREHYHISLSHFTIINEGLRQRPDLSNLLNVLLVQKRMIDQSAARTQQVMMATETLDDLVHIRSDFNAAARGPTKLQRQFKSYARKILGGGRKPAKPSANVSVPWSPGI